MHNNATFNFGFIFNLIARIKCFEKQIVFNIMSRIDIDYNINKNDFFFSN